MQKARSSQTLQPQKPPKFHQLKQLEYFKQILRKIEDPHLKQILPFYICKQYTRELDHSNYVYVPDRAVDECGVGVAVDESVGELSRRVWLYRVEKKMDRILRTVVDVDIPVLRELRIVDRLALFNQSMLESYAFNRAVCRKGEQFLGIYFILQGQLKILQDKSPSALKLLPKHTFICLQQLQKQSQTYTTTILSNTNTTQLLFISLESVNRVRPASEVVLRDRLLVYAENQQNFGGVLEDGGVGRKRNIEKMDKARERERGGEGVGGRMDLGGFVRKCQEFLKGVDRNDKGFNDYLKSKKILLQLRQSMSAAKTTQKNPHPHPLKITTFKQPCTKSTKLNTNTLTCRSQLLKQNIMRRLEISKNCTQMEFMPVPISVGQLMQVEIGGRR